ncbi:MAG: alpha/beta hydrolase [Chitinophagaceae bacterium]|nr:alpha/beta hydrolase [Chitinophagaceae bacterium]
MKKVYFISGLGADKRVFSFLDLSFCEPVYIDWIPPEKNETLENYATRLRGLIDEPKPTIVGISFGGMLATEMAKRDPSINAILMASSKTASEIPRYLKAARYFPFFNWVPPGLLKRSTYLVKQMVGRNDPDQKRILLDIIRDSDMLFVKWAMNAILRWKNTEVPGNIIHIHGTADRILPYRLVHSDYTIQGGSHVLPMDQHAEISALLKKLVG